jgi:hypothetical protein
MTDDVAIARVTGVRRSRYIEFDYIHGGTDLKVALILPMEALKTFCAERCCEICAGSSEAREALMRLDRPSHPDSSGFASIPIRESSK